ncbi:MAG: hypothetical protein ACE5HC_06585 [Candidatus Binatia bacterium]
MSLYQLQKFIHHVNRDAEQRDQFRQEPTTFLSHYDLTDDEKKAVLEVDTRKLYRLGVHPLLLRPFTLFHGVSAEDYAKALSGLE